ncbi:hypothetical protein CHCC5026_3420 [Bacillus licheniformis]|nr:hypothetical protein CHCC5026_3420 [Bacillus licheniformis]TWL01652.1 hypothetical protein CHCC20325_0750 [Bacillus licheniformis]
MNYFLFYSDKNFVKKMVKHAARTVKAAVPIFHREFEPPPFCSTHLTIGGAVF